MKWVYAGLMLIIITYLLKFRNYKKDMFAALNSKEHPVKLLYPPAAWLVDRFGRNTKGKQDRHIASLLKSLYVRENVEKEQYLFRVKKTALILAVTAIIIFLGLIVCISGKRSLQVNNISRAGYGEGKNSYELEVSYRDEKENIELTVDEVKLTRSEIIERFEDAYEEVKQLMLGENESQDNITESIDLITEFNGIDIYWEIDDLSVINYNGEIKQKPEEDDSIIVTLTASFSIDDVIEIYTYPLRLVGKELTSGEKLLEQIRAEIDENNDIHESRVDLPKEIDGYSVRFFSIGSEGKLTFILIAIAAVTAILFLYDRSLEDKVKKRQEELMIDYPEIISRLSLLYGAGMSIHSAFERIVNDKDMQDKKDHYAYKEMRLVLEKIKSGVNEGEAYAQFGKRCGLHAYIKLGNILEQNLNKGTKGMSLILSQEAAAAFEERKRNARKKGEQAGTKMLVPMVMMLLVAIAIIAIPALMSMRF